MPQVVNAEFQLAQKGTYHTMLCEIEVKTAQQKNDKGEERENKFWVWKFRGYRTNDANKTPVPVEISTGNSVTAKDSGLKSLLMSAYPDKTLDEIKAFNTDEMIGKAWMLKVGVGENRSGNEKNIILNIEPSEEDPFAD